MRKEVFFAIVAGVLFGLVIALGVWRANSALKEKSDPIAITGNPQITSTPTSSDLTISEPEEHDVITASPVVVKGITSPNTWIAISAEEDDYTFQSDALGEFDQEVDLAGGVNQLVVSTFPGESKTIEKTLTVVFSTEFATKE